MLVCSLDRDNREKYTRVYERPEIVPALILTLVSVLRHNDPLLARCTPPAAKLPITLSKKSIPLKNYLQLELELQRKKTAEQNHLYV